MKWLTKYELKQVVKYLTRKDIEDLSTIDQWTLEHIYNYYAISENSGICTLLRTIDSPELVVICHLVAPYLKGEELYYINGLENTNELVADYYKKFDTKIMKKNMKNKLANLRE